MSEYVRGLGTDGEYELRVEFPTIDKLKFEARDKKKIRLT